jgi:hypothetical protein
MTNRALRKIIIIKLFTLGVSPASVPVFCLFFEKVFMQSSGPPSPALSLKRLCCAGTPASSLMWKGFCLSPFFRYFHERRWSSYYRTGIVLTLGHIGDRKWTVRGRPVSPALVVTCHLPMIIDYYYYTHVWTPRGLTSMVDTECNGNILMGGFALLRILIQIDFKTFNLP